MNKFLKAIKIFQYLISHDLNKMTYGDFIITKEQDIIRIWYNFSMVCMLYYGHNKFNSLLINKPKNMINIGTSTEPSSITVLDKQFSTELLNDNINDSSFQDLLSEPLLFELMKLPMENYDFGIYEFVVDKFIQDFKLNT